MYKINATSLGQQIIMFDTELGDGQSRTYQTLINPDMPSGLFYPY